MIQFRRQGGKLEIGLTLGNFVEGKGFSVAWAWPRLSDGTVFVAFLSISDAGFKVGKQRWSIIDNWLACNDLRVVDRQWYENNSKGNHVVLH